MHERKQDLLDFTAQIAAKIPIFIEPRSKFARGLHLLGNGEEHEIPKGRLKIDRGGMVQDELSKLMEYYGDRILKLQNRLLTDKNVLVQADKLLLPRSSICRLYWRLSSRYWLKGSMIKYVNYWRNLLVRWMYCFVINGC